FGALSEINVNAAYDAALSYLDFPLIILEVDRKTLEYAKIIAEFSKTTYDALHAALVAQNELEVVVTEDLDDWKKILKAWPKLMKKYHVKEIYVFSPARNKVLQI
ncbi:MAG: VapC-like toxin, partial [Thermoprotei archaeon]